MKEKTKEKMGNQGEVTVTVRDARTGQIKKITVFKNKITTLNLNDLRDYRKGDNTDGEIKYLAWGDDNTAPVAGDTSLGHELGRKAVTSKTATGAGVLETIVFLASYDANESIEELGWFAGALASATPNSGTLIARVLYSHAKTELETIQVTRTDTFSEVP